MTNTYNISGSGGNILTQILRGLFLAVAAIGSLFMVIFLGAFAFFVVAGLVLVGFIAFGFLWARAKLFGRPFGPRAQFEAARKDMEAQFKAQKSGISGEGPIIDAHQTPEGWSVDD